MKLKTTVAALVSAEDGKKTFTLSAKNSNKPRGELTVVTEEIGDSSSELFLTLAGSKLDKKGTFFCGLSFHIVIFSYMWFFTK